jgi:hypothetical protein
MKMTNPSAKYYGSKNKDTKGGPWQISSNGVGYHTLPMANST